MAGTIRIGTFNVENLFSRAKILNLRSNAAIAEKLKLLTQLQTELQRTQYNKTKIRQLYRVLRRYVSINQQRGKLLRETRDNVIVVAKGKKDWDGRIVLRRDTLGDVTRRNTGRVIQEIDAHIMCLIEVEDRLVLSQFNDELLKTRKFPFNMLIDGNDPRGIDVGLLSRFPIGRMASHIFDRHDGARVFSRDCLETEIRLDWGRSLWVLLNHFKSKSGGDPPSSRNRRERQAERVKEILAQNYDLTRDLVAVCGDLNDTPDSTPLAPLLSVPHLHDVLEVKFGANVDERWTYFFNGKQQIDYLLVSDPLRDALQDAAVERRGIFKVGQFTDGQTQPFDTITRDVESASDHGAVWADFKL